MKTTKSNNEDTTDKAAAQNKSDGLASKPRGQSKAGLSAPLSKLPLLAKSPKAENEGRILNTCGIIRGSQVSRGAVAKAANLQADEPSKAFKYPPRVSGSGLRPKPCCFVEYQKRLSAAQDEIYGLIEDGFEWFPEEHEELHNQMGLGESDICELMDRYSSRD